MTTIQHNGNNIGAVVNHKSFSVSTGQTQSFDIISVQLTLIDEVVIDVDADAGAGEEYGEKKVL